MAFRVDKYTRYIEGHGDFEIEIKLDRDTKLFSTEIPVPVDSDELPRLTYLCDDTWSGLSKQIEQKITEFELFEKESELVIIYKFNERRDYRDGAGIGMNFMWGVYKKIVHKGKPHYTWERGDEFSKKMSSVWHQNFQDYKEIEHTQVREDFFKKVAEKLDLLRQQLEYFLSSSDIQDDEELQAYLDSSYSNKLLS